MTAIRNIRALALAGGLAAALALAPAAAAKTTPNKTFASTGKAQLSGAALGSGADGTYEDFPFTIAPDEQNGSASVGIMWTSSADDFDLYVYHKNSKGELETVGSSAGGPPNTTENAVFTAPSEPLPAGSYVVRVQNYAAANPDFTGFVKFSPYVPANRIPLAKLAAPGTAKSGHAVTLNASKSKDLDGSIVNYAFDLDGDGAIDVDSGKTSKIKHAFGAGTHHVAVRVTDDKGARAYANATIVVSKARAATKKKHH